MGPTTLWGQLTHGRGTDEQASKEFVDATNSGLESVGRGVKGAIRGIGQTFDPRPQPGENAITASPAGRMIRGLGSLGKSSTEIPAAIHDINASPDPASIYGKAAQDAAGEGAGQALTALGTEGLTRAVPKVAAAVTNPKIAGAPIRMGARAAETAINQKIVPLRSLANIMSPADEAADLQFKVPGRDLGLPKPIPKAEPPLPTTNMWHGPEAPEPTTNVLHGPEKPTPEMFQARGLQLGGKPYADPAAGLGKIPVSTPEAAAAPAAESVKETPASVKETSEAKIPSTSRSALYKKLDQPLRESVNAPPPIQRGVSLKDQIPSSAATPKAELPEGYKPTESSLIRGYKYDPATETFHSVTNTGQHYAYKGVTPDQFKAFEDAPSKGSAWNQLRRGPGVVQVEKNFRPTIPSTMQTEAGETIPMKQAGMSQIPPALEKKLGNLQDFIKPGRGTGAAEEAAPTAQPAKGGIRGLNLKAFRARSIGEEGIPYNRESHAQATMGKGEAESYKEGRESLTGEPQEVVETDLSKSPGFSVIPRGDSPSWVKFHAAMPESSITRAAENGAAGSEDLTPILKKSLDEAKKAKAKKK